MKQEDIRIGKTYKNRGAGTTRRTVIAIGQETEENRPHWWSSGPRPHKALVVTYRPWGYPGLRHLYLKSFAAWAGSEVEE